MFRLNSPLDMHLHLRDGDMLALVAPLSSGSFAGGMIMPNLVPPITDKESLLSYKSRIMSAIKDDIFEPYMTLFFQNYSYDFLDSIKGDITAIKLYPAGITTNSENGISDFSSIHTTLKAMEELGIILSVHGETNGFVMDREKEFLAVYRDLAREFPKLKIVMEHITTKDSLTLLDEFPNIFATVTLHHLLITLDDVASGMLRPHLFCKPIAKRYEDRDALLEYALKAHPKLMFGSDSAPHPKHKKESCGCAAGVFTAPIALECLVSLFEKHNSLDNLNKFVSDNAISIYEIEPPKKIIEFEKVDKSVPKYYSYNNEVVVPFMANERLEWSICNIS